MHLIIKRRGLIHKRTFLKSIRNRRDPEKSTYVKYYEFSLRSPIKSRLHKSQSIKINIVKCKSAASWEDCTF